MHTIAIIEKPAFGVRDFPNGRPGLWFTVTWNDTFAALITLQGAEMERFLVNARIYDIKHLEGKQCLIEDGGFGAGRIRFLGLLSHVEGTAQVREETQALPEGQSA